jgi:hypothetical protein
MNAVALVLDPDFSQRLERLARKMPVWILSSASNDPVVEQTRNIRDDDNITSFFPLGLADRTTTCTQALYDIDEHHGPWSSSHPYDTLLVFGASATDFSPQALEELGLEPAGTDEDALVLRKRHDTPAAAS